MQAGQFGGQGESTCTYLHTNTFINIFKTGHCSFSKAVHWITVQRG